MREPDVIIGRRRGRRHRDEPPPSAAGRVDPALVAVVRAAVVAHRDQRGPLLPVLHAIQEQLGHVPAEAVPVLAGELNLSRAEVHGVLTFYQDFREKPPAQSSVRVCRAEACQAVGADLLYGYARDLAASSSGGIAVEQVFCLGNCALGPSAEVNGRLHGRVDSARLRELL
ncbi:MAG: NAD(P)H-dependent oxidoreductase subunit E [Actinoplanes sp.]